MLRRFLAWVMVFGVFAGLSVRALPEILEMGHSHAACHDDCGQEEIAAAHDHGDGEPCAHGHDDSAPGHEHAPCHHHHHGCCGSPLNLSAEQYASVGLCPPGASLLGVWTHDDRLPEAPVFEEDAPPLI